MEIRWLEEGLWRVGPDGSLTFVSEDYFAVEADGVIYRLRNQNRTWCVQADEDIIIQGEPAEEASWERMWVPYTSIGTLTELDGWLYFVLCMEDNTCCLCRMRTDGTGFAMFPEYDVKYFALLTAEDRVVLRVQIEDDLYPAAFDPETGTFTVLSETPANITNRYYVDGDRVWWTYVDRETEKAVQCSVPVTGGETETLDLENICHVGGGNILLGDAEELQVMDIRSGETRTYALPFHDYPMVADAADWGAVLINSYVDGRDYWLLDYDTGTWTPLALE